MTAAQKLKQYILWQADIIVTEFDVDEIYEKYSDDDEEEPFCLHDIEEEVRSGQVETDIRSESSRHYESKSVASQMLDGSWVGWTYWYGGGKHGEPEAIEWISKAYDLDCVEQERLVIVRTFKKI